MEDDTLRDIDPASVLPLYLKIAYYWYPY